MSTLKISPKTPRRELLRALYRFQAGVEATRQVACAPGCAACCTDQVFLTSLEGDLLREELERLGRQDIVERLEPGAAPAYTCNQLARLCLEQKEPPQESAPGRAPGVCSLLEEGRCAVYEVRPLACRVMASRETCGVGGQAQGDPWWFTLDTALLQIAEHLNLGGVYGVLGTVLTCEKNAGEEELLPCEPLPGLVAPPEHQARLQQTLGPLFATVVAGHPLGHWLDILRAG
ncbi:MAG: YkgJ family cysteine cluster protein [Deltaproteobacteria bacterium]|nr:YkgJ family cysteine cluster protein [Deltaproteobacteria bacterium]